MQKKLKFSKFPLFCFHGNGSHFGKFEPPKVVGDTYKSILCSLKYICHKNFDFLKNNPFFVSMATVKKFVKQITILIQGTFIQSDKKICSAVSVKTETISKKNFPHFMCFHGNGGYFEIFFWSMHN